MADNSDLEKQPSQSQSLAGSTSLGSPLNHSSQYRQKLDSPNLSLSYEASFAGPIPSPQVLRQYEEAVPGLAKTLIQMTQEESIHRRQMEERQFELRRDSVRWYFRERALGQIFGFLIAITAIVTGGLIAYHSQTVGGKIAGAGVGTVGLLGIVSVFVLGRKWDDSPDDDEKAERPPAEQSAPVVSTSDQPRVCHPDQPPADDDSVSTV